MASAELLDAAAKGPGESSRSSFSVMDTISSIWTGLSLPPEALEHLTLEGDGDHGYPSSFKIGHVAQASIALSALAATLVDSLRGGMESGMKDVHVSLYRACLEYSTVQLYSVAGVPATRVGGDIGGIYETKDGHVRIHDGFPHHRDGTLRLLGLPLDASTQQVKEKVRAWGRFELEEAAVKTKLATYALRTYQEWDSTPQGQAVPDLPIIIRKISDDGPRDLPERMQGAKDRCLRGLRVLELTRVVAGPVAGKTLASHGADSLWVTSPNLPDMPVLDRNFSRGKRSIQLDLQQDRDREKLLDLVRGCDVFLQGYRGGSVGARGLGAYELAKLHPGLIYANMSAFGPDGPWSHYRGFDSLVQTASGMNASEAEHFGAGGAARPMPVQALDYTSGFFLATGVMAALYRRATEGGSWEVHVSLAGTMKYMRSLGQYPGKSGFDCPYSIPTIDSVPGEIFEEAESAFGLLRALKEAPEIRNAMPGFDGMSEPLNNSKAEWLS